MAPEVPVLARDPSVESLEFEREDSDPSKQQVIQEDDDDLVRSE